MKNINSRPEFTAAIRKVSDVDMADDGNFPVIAKILQTREVRQMLGNILPDLLRIFAGKSVVKRSIMKGVGKYLKKSLSRPGDIFEEQELRLLFEDGNFVQSIATPIPEMVNGLFEVISTAVSTIEGFETDEKKALFASLFSASSDPQTATLITRFARIFIDIHGDDPEFLTRTLGPGLARMIDNTDFGDLKVFLDGTFKDITSLTRVINEAMFDKPAKVVLLLTILPMLVNMLAKILDDTVGRFNSFPPDLVADVILALVREVDARAVGALTNEVMELFRKINVGSALIGDPGMPQCRLDMSRFIEDFTAEIDIDLLWKFREAVAVSRERVDLSMLAVLKKNPDLVINRLRKAPGLKNFRIKSANQKLELIENLPEKEATEALSEGIAKIDTNLIAEWINLSTLLLNRLNESSPDVLPGLADQLISTLDLYAVEDTVKWAVENLGEVLKPLGRIIMPNLIKMAAGWLSANGDGYDEDLAHARETIFGFTAQKEVEA